MSAPGLIVLCGPTATGKSDRALELALDLKVALLNADSRQIYREFDIGTAKPTPDQQALWPHHLINIADPRETFTVAQYQAQAQALVRQFHQEGQTPILVGGTGLYIQSVTQGLGIPSVPPQPTLRRQLLELPQELLYSFLQQVDPQASHKIHPHDQVRTLRSLEIYYSTGKAASELKTQTSPPFRILTLGLTCPMDRLKERIAQRTQQMLQRGWMEEVIYLQEKYGTDLPLLQTLGYAEIGQYLRQELTSDLLLPQIVHHTRHFAKRQMTWFRRVSGIQWLDCEAKNLTTQIQEKVMAFLG
jgi:tRNA dimethylallyltransferase